MSLKVVPFKTLGAVSYSPSTVIMAISVAVCDILLNSTGGCRRIFIARQHPAADARY